MKKLGEVGMTGLLLRLFVINYTDAENTQVRTDVGKLAGVVGIFCNGLLFLDFCMVSSRIASVIIPAVAQDKFSKTVFDLSVFHSSILRRIMENNWVSSAHCLSFI